MAKRDWLLLAVGDRIEPIQLQKTLFKFGMESGAPKEIELYDFIPYNWGPCSFEIYDDLDTLRTEGLIESVPSDRGWSIYRLTESGKAKAIHLRRSLNNTLVRQLDATREYVTGRDFETLLKDIYAQYPEFAKESLFRR